MPDDQDVYQSPIPKIFSGMSAAPQQPLEYEETPVIEPMADPTPKQTPSYQEAPKMNHRTSSPFGALGSIFLFLVLFGVGIWLSMYLRNFLPNGLSTKTEPNTGVPTTTTTPEAVHPYIDWKTYEILNATTKQPLTELSFKLPSDVLSPICDGPSCASQGTYLPGGTRFTVAARGSGQALADYRGATVTDVGGKEFATTNATVGGHPGLEFNGVFTGTTVGGYVFSRMRGVMIAVTDTLSIEVNHFIPSGVNADFEGDDMLFSKILNSIEFTVPVPTEPATPTPTSTVTPVPTSTPIPTATLTPTMTVPPTPTTAPLR